MSKTSQKSEKIKWKAGFSLVETLVAITILLIAILAPMRIIAESIKAAVFSREQLTAVLLAEESLEAVIQLRDNDALDGGDTWSWYSGLIAANCDDTPGNGCGYEPADGTFFPCGGGPSCKIYLDTSASDGVYYTHASNGNEETPYTRRLFLEEVETDREASVTATVEWESAALNETVSVDISTRIFDQYE